MLNKVFCLGALSLMCLSGVLQSATVTDQFVDYKIEGDTYAVVYIELESMTTKEAKELALQRAAEVAKSNGFRYFQVQSEQQVEVASTSSPSNPFGGNIYEEKIIQGETGTTSFEQRTEPTTGGIYPGYKIIFQCYNEKPSSSSYDTCDYVEC